MGSKRKRSRRSAREASPAGLEGERELSRAPRREGVLAPAVEGATPATGGAKLSAALAALALAVAALVFYWPIVAPSDAFGIHDWDLQLFLYEAARRSIVVHGDWPLWNPWYCGGGPLLANPQSVVLDPFFGLVIAFGTIAGAKLSVAAHAFVGMLGAWLLARRLGARGLAPAIAAIAFGTTGVYTLHVATGHLNWLALGWLPFVAACTLGAIDAACERRTRRAVLEVAAAGGALAATLFAGNAYVFVYASLFVAILGLLGPFSRRADAARVVAVAAGVLVAAAAFAAVKLVPMLAYLGRVAHYEIADSSGATLEWISISLTRRDPELVAPTEPAMQWRHWEYGAYVGTPVLVLALVGAIVAWRRVWPLVVAAVFFVGVAMGNAGPVWPLLRGLHAFEGLRVPSRAIVMVVLVVAPLAAVGADAIVERARRARIVPDELAPLVLALAAAALFANACLVTRPALDEAFAAPPTEPAPPALPEFRQVQGRREFVTHTRYTDHYDHAVRNEGALNCHERLHLPIRPKAELTRAGRVDPTYRGEVYALAGRAKVRVARFGPSRAVLAVEGDADEIVWNQNADPGFSARSRGAPLEVRDEGGLVAVVWPGGAGEIEIEYAPRSARAGAAITLFALVGLAAFAARTRRRRSAPAA